MVCTGGQGPQGSGWRPLGQESKLRVWPTGSCFQNMLGTLLPSEVCKGWQIPSAHSPALCSQQQGRLIKQGETRAAPHSQAGSWFDTTTTVSLGASLEGPRGVTVTFTSRESFTFQQRPSYHPWNKRSQPKALGVCPEALPASPRSTTGERISFLSVEQAPQDSPCRC